MLQKGSVCEIIDNSGAKEAKCICILGGFFNKNAVSGTLILVSIRKLRLIRRVKLGQIFLAVVTRTRKWARFKDGVQSKFDRNAIVLLTQKQQIFGSKVGGPVSRKLRKKKFLKILLSSGSIFF